MSPSALLSSAALEAPPWSTLKASEHRSHKKKVHTIAWNCTGAKLASGSVDQSVRVWSLAEGATSGAGVTDMELTGHQDSVDQLRWDPKNAEVLGTASGDKTVRIWDARTGKCAHAIETKGENINIRWSPDGQHLAVGDKEDNISIIETRKSKPLKNIKFAFEVNEMAPQHARSKCPGPQPAMRPPAAPEAHPLARGCPLRPGGEPVPLGCRGEAAAYAEACPRPNVADVT